MPVVKHYYVIYIKLGLDFISPKKIIGVVEDEDIAKDFCKKYDSCDYFEETIDLHIGE